MSRKKFDAKTIITVILAFVLSIVLTSGTYLVGIRGGYLSKNSITKSIKESNYVVGLHDYVLEEIEYFSTPMGIPSEVIEEVFTQEIFEKDVKAYFNSKLKNEVVTLSGDELAENLETKVKEYLSSQNITMSKEQESVLTTYIEDIKTEYQSLLKMPFIDQFVKVQKLYAKLFYPLMLGLIIFSVVIIIFMKKLQRWTHCFYRYLSYSTLAAFMMSVIIPVSALVTQFYRKIVLTPKYFYDIIMTYLQNGFIVMLLCSIVWILVSAWLLLKVAKYKTKVKRSRH